MKEAFRTLEQNICNFQDAAEVDKKILDNFIKNTVVALAVGGEGKRLLSVTQGKVNKNALEVTKDGQTMVERIISMYKQAGIKDFVCLVFTKSDSIIKRLGDGKTLGVKIQYSFDPDKPVGRGGAILNALLNKKIPEHCNLIVHNPDDQIVNYSNFVEDIIKAHLFGIKKNCLATVIVSKTTPYTFTGMKICDSIVHSIEMYPQIPVPAHIGVTVFSPKVYPLFKKLFNLEQKVDFEKILFPVLCEKKQLYAFGIENEHWIPVNDPKNLEKLRSILGFYDKEKT